MKQLAEIVRAAVASVGPDDVVAPPDTEDPVSCAKCGDGGFVRHPLGHPLFGRVKPCPRCFPPETDEQRVRRLRRGSGLDRPAFRDKSFANYRIPKRPSRQYPREVIESMETALRAAHRFANQPDGGLVLLGDNGCGKTHLAVAAGNHRLDHVHPVVFVVVPDLLDDLRAGYGDEGGGSFDARFERIRNAPFLVLDDFGAFRATEWALEKLFQLIDHRATERLPTIVTSDLSAAMLKSRYRRIAVRILDPSAGSVVGITAGAYALGGE